MISYNIITQPAKCVTHNTPIIRILNKLCTQLERSTHEILKTNKINGFLRHVFAHTSIWA